jgi:hypothetical protein
MFAGFVVSNPSLQGQLRSLMAKVTSESVDPPPPLRPRWKPRLLCIWFASFCSRLVILFFFACVAVRVSGHVTTKTLPALMKGLNEVASEEEVVAFLSETYPDSD